MRAELLARFSPDQLPPCLHQREYNSLCSRVKQLCVIQEQLDVRIQSNMEKIANHSETAVQLRRQDATCSELEMFGLTPILEEPDEELLEWRRQKRLEEKPPPRRTVTLEVSR